MDGSMGMITYFLVFTTLDVLFCRDQKNFLCCYGYYLLVYTSENCFHLSLVTLETEMFTLSYLFCSDFLPTISYVASDFYYITCVY